MRRDAPAASAAAPPDGALRILAVQPDSGALAPRVKFRIQFDRPLDRATISGETINCEYLEARAEFIGNPFRLTATWFDGDGSVVFVQPPELLTGRDIRLVVRDGVRGADGSSLQPSADLPQGVAFMRGYRVLELPEPWEIASP